MSNDAQAMVDGPRVLHKAKDGVPLGAVYVGRPTKWGNPFVVNLDGTRDEVVDKFEEWLTQNKFLMKSLDELRGKDLVCWCAPQRCHAEVLMRYANA